MRITFGCWIRYLTEADATGTMAINPAEKRRAQ